MRDFALPDPQEVVNVSAHTASSEVALAIESALLKCPGAVSSLLQTYSCEMVHMAAAMFTAGKIAGVRQERSKQRRHRVKMEVVVNA